MKIRQTMAALGVAGLLLGAPAVHSAVTTFELNHVLAPNGDAVTGSFDWTFTPGDFENGSGQFSSLDIPGYGSGLFGLVVTIDLTTIEFSLAGNFHSQQVDVNLRLLSPLSPTQGSSIDTSVGPTGPASKYSVFGFGRSINGGVLGGSIQPVAAVVPLPAGVWLFGAALMTLLKRRMRR